MDNNRQKLIMSLADEALELPAPERRAFLENRCENDNKLFAEVQELIESITESELVWDSWISGKDTLFDHMLASQQADGLKKNRLSESEAARIGPWETLHVIGRGGMGAVFLARKPGEGFRRNVALKVLEYDFLQPESVRRFEQEQQILARLEHPAIARLYEAGVDDIGRPWIAMEYIDGKPITEWCREKNAGLRERVELFVQVCDAVRYAHNNLVVHRDLKPDNIMVRQSKTGFGDQTDEKMPGGVVVLDFGIAKLLDDQITAPNLMKTQAGLRPLSLHYAAPEQIEGQPVTTATDVYALGLLLYELVTETYPFDFSGKNLRQIEQIICNHIPDRPSRAKPDLSVQLRGDLDAIVMKALEKDPAHRYANAGEMMQDVRMYLDNRPVSARHHTTLYRFGKYVKRHLRGVITAAAVLFAFVSMGVYYTIELASERDAARIEAEKSNRIAEFLKEMFFSSDPFSTQGEEVTALQLLDRGRERIASLDHEPQIKAELLHVMAIVYRNLGQYDNAKELARESISLIQSIRGDHTPLHIAAIRNLGIVRINQGAYHEADSLLRLAYSLARSSAELTDNELASAMHDLGYIFQGMGSFEEALELYHNSLAMSPDTDEAMHRMSTTHLNLGWLSIARGDYQAADAHLQKSLQMRTQMYGEDHVHTASVLVAISRKLSDQRRLSEAYDTTLRMMDIYNRVFEPEHPSIASALITLAGIERNLGAYKDAEMNFRKALAIEIKHRGKENMPVAHILNNLAIGYQQQGLYAEADSAIRASFALHKSLLPAGHPFTTVVTGNVAFNMHHTGDTDSAAILYEKAIAEYRATFPELNSRAALLMFNYAALLIDTGRFEEARELLFETVPLFDVHLGPEHWRSKLAHATLAGLITLIGPPFPTDIFPGIVEVPDSVDIASAVYYRDGLRRIVNLYASCDCDEQLSYYSALIRE